MAGVSAYLADMDALAATVESSPELQRLLERPDLPAERKIAALKTAAAKDPLAVSAIARAHGERFGHILPANTLVEARLVGAEYLVEIEADAIVSES